MSSFDAVSWSILSFDVDSWDIDGGADVGPSFDADSFDTDSWSIDSWDLSGETPPVIVVNPPSPHQLVHTLVPNVLDMPIPLLFTQYETGPVEFILMGADGTREDLTTATSCTLRVTDYAGTPIVNSVDLTDLGSDGTATWERLSSQVDTAGDYRYQVRVVRSNSDIAYYPDSQFGMPLTILPVV